MMMLQGRSHTVMFDRLARKEMFEMARPRSKGDSLNAVPTSITTAGTSTLGGGSIGRWIVLALGLLKARVSTHLVIACGTARDRNPLSCAQ
jgi:hypothetical protein